MKNKMTGKEINRALAIADNKGREAGESAAAWIEQDSWGGRIASGRQARENAAAFLRKLDDGDMIEVSPPSLSGEWADGETPESLLSYVAWKLGREESEIEELADDICTAWEEASFASFWESLETSARSVAFPNS